MPINVLASKFEIHGSFLDDPSQGKHEDETLRGPVGQRETFLREALPGWHVPIAHAPG